MSDYKKLENQPLKFVLAEFRFSPVLQIAEFIPRIQEALRKRYPIPKKKSEQAIQIQPDGVAVSKIDSWAFISADKKSAVDVNQERLLYITTDYPRFEGFSASCEHALAMLMEIVEPNLIFRIGLRYGDLIKVNETETLSELVTDHFGYPQPLHGLGSARHQTVELFLSTDMGGLAIRTLYGLHNLTCLPDVQGLPVAISADSEASERLVLDFDHFWEAGDESVNFDTADVLQKLSALHETSREAFWKVTTDYARNVKWS